MRHRYNKIINYDKVVNNRFNVFIVVIICLFSILGLKLYSVMVLERKENTSKLLALTSNKVTLNSSPRGRIYDRNYNIIVDNKAINTIVYKKDKSVSNKEMIELAYKVSPYLDLDYHKLSLRNKKEFFLAKYPDICNDKITSKERTLVKERKLTNQDIEELKIERITDEELDEFSDKDIKAAYLFN